MTIKWQDPDVWASWTICGWQPFADPLSWNCLLPKGHSGPHVAHLNMENDPTGQSYVDRGGKWEAPQRCPLCNNPHPGFRHSTRNDSICIQHDWHRDSWGPDTNPEFPDGTELQLSMYVPTFVDTFPTPPKFATMEEAEAWLEANPP
jgi:hypothetical protein